MTEEKELTEVTKRILKRTNQLKKNIKSSMMHGEVNIIKGIVIFEVILKELNPSILDENEINKIEEYTRKYLIEKEDLTQHVNVCVHYGVNRCFLILESSNESEEKKMYKKR